MCVYSKDKLSKNQMTKVQANGVKERILVAAKELFIAKGYTGTSIRDIASASDSNVAHVKYYFQSKANLFEIIFDEAFDILIKRVSATITSDLPFEEMIEKWITTYFELLPHYPQIPLFILNEINHSPDALIQKVARKNPEKIFNRLSERLEEEIKKGTVRPMPVFDLGLNILSLCIFPFIFTGFATRAVGVARSDYNNLIANHKQHVVDFVLQAIRP